MHVTGHDLFQALVKVSSLSAHTQLQTRPGTSQTPTAAEPQKAAVEDSAPPEDRVAALRYQKSEKTMLKLRTQEGDVVRIKIQNRTSAEVAGTDDAGDDGFESLALSLKSSSKLRVKVKGHLNEDELAAIQDAIEQASDIADYFFANDVDGAFAAAGEFNLDTEQLSGMKLRLRMRESALYSGPMTRLPEPAAQAPQGGEVTPDSATSDSAQLPGASTVGASDGVAAAPAPVETDAPADGATDDVAPVATDGPAPIDSNSMAEALRAISDFLSHVVDVVTNSDTGRPSDQLSVSIKIRLVRSTVEALAEFREAGEIPDPLLPGDILDALAAEYEPPLEKVG